ncbi:hypothetical protein [Neorhodopirellula pilleata]|uniref:Uncharacterized protein n=1 Tax=Neorhodopirellula pilleata TaxID=2714738 RepID=A0A5C6AIK6_9BACT|nr:hypothetical protein [Neorhodopirellula pilleata]TWT99005.1 hypothetical protein Pla100_21720 [Neorhodopirellula pilleata]
MGVKKEVAYQEEREPGNEFQHAFQSAASCYDVGKDFIFNKETTVRGSGGTEGGTRMFGIGVAMAIAAVYLFFDSVRVATGHPGAISGMLGGGRGRLIETTSMGIVFVPFFLGVFSLFVDAQRKWAWGLTYLGIAILAVEVLSRVRFIIDTKLTHMLLMFTLFAAGCAFMFRSYRPDPSDGPRSSG